MKIAILTPNWNDWDSVALLMRDLNQEFAKTEHDVSVCIVDDGSHQKEPQDFRKKFSHLKSVELLFLSANLGHQKAIAIGIGYLGDRAKEFDSVLIMDSDGEDSPKAAREMVEIALQKNSSFVVAQRAKRSESLTFRFSYFFYKLFFFVCTGKIMDFGNFMFLKSEILKPLSFSPHTGSHLASSILRSRLTYDSTPTVRNLRYFGNSKMGFVGLIIHGLSAISVFSEVVLSRCLIMLSLFSVVTFLGILAVLGVRIFTTLGVPGWATYVSLALLVLLVQSLLGIIFLCFLVLNNRQANPWIPALHYKQFILKVEKF